MYINTTAKVQFSETIEIEKGVTMVHVIIRTYV